MARSTRMTRVLVNKLTSTNLNLYVLHVDNTLFLLITHMDRMKVTKTYFKKIEWQQC